MSGGITYPRQPSDPTGAFAGTERFTPVALIGRGSMGLVYRVHDRDTDTEVALKTLGAREPEQLYQLKREFRSLAGIVHPNLVELYELIVTGSESFFTMELVEGADFVEHVRARADQTDVGGLLDAARQLALGLAAVHAAGKLHRDIKPSNILVGPEGRVVLLDFGLATALGLDGAPDTESSLGGTLAYMAPEQFWDKPPHPAADWYSVGVVLYEGLTGQLPFTGPPARVLQQKSASAPPAPSTRAPGMTAELDALVGALLHPDPACRPGTAEIVERLERMARALRLGRSRSSPPEAEGTTARETARQSSRRGPVPPFVGRALELAALQSTFDKVRRGEMAIVHILGRSGIGKSELIRRFLSAVEAEGQAVVLRGRCHPQESVPYNALDTVVDALSRRLMIFPGPKVTALAPQHVAALIRLFPVLGCVPALSAGDRDRETAEPHEIRRRGFGAFRELLASMVARGPVILWIDDLQWSDLDSVALLRDVLRPPDAPLICLIVSYRSEDLVQSPALAEFVAARQEWPAEWTQQIELGPLSPTEATQLTRLLCAGQPDSDERGAAIVAESGGSPFFIAQLARSVAGPTKPASLRLADLLRDRLQQLEPVARALLEVVSVAGGPVQRSVALNVTGLGERGRPLVSRLEHRFLLRTTRASDEVAVEMYHDRLREALLVQLGAERTRALHRDLAETLRLLPDADPYSLFTHYLGGGERHLAGEYAVQAADRAAGALAFERAAELYRHALALREREADRPGLFVKLAEALANAGRGHEAGESYEAAADARGNACDDTAVALRLQAADQHLRAGGLERGARLLRRVLTELGVPLPRTATTAVLSSLVQRARFLLRGLRFVARDAERIPARTLLRIDACWAAVTKLSVFETVLGDGIGVRGAIEALNAGERMRIIRAVAFEAAREAALGISILDGHSQRLLRTAQRLAEASGDPYERAWLHQCVGGSAYFRGFWRPAYEGCAAAAETFRRHCRGVAWEITTSESFALSALGQMGEIGRLARLLPAAIGDADQRGDAYASMGLRLGVLSLVWLAADRPEYVLQVGAEQIAKWPRDKFLVQHYLYLLGVVQADLYLNDPWKAWRRLCEAWPLLLDSYLMNMAIARVELPHLRARAALAAAAARDLPTGACPPDSAWPRERLLHVARREARRLGRERFPSARVFVAFIEGALASAQGHEESAVERFRQAEVLALQADMKLHAAAASHCYGAVCGGDDGQWLQQRAATWMAEQDVVNHAAMLRTVAPGCVRDGQRS